MPRRKKQKQNEASKRKAPEEYIDWLRSTAKKIILYDLENEILSLDEDEEPAESAWEYYRQLDEFHGVPLKQFKERLTAHRKQLN